MDNHLRLPARSADEPRSGGRIRAPFQRLARRREHRAGAGAGRGMRAHSARPRTRAPNVRARREARAAAGARLEDRHRPGEVPPHT